MVFVVACEIREDSRELGKIISGPIGVSVLMAGKEDCGNERHAYGML